MCAHRIVRYVSASRDDYLAIGPWNKFGRTPNEPRFLPRAELTAPRLVEPVALDDANFHALLAGSPIDQISQHRFVRNGQIAIGNTGRWSYWTWSAFAMERLPPAAAMVRSEREAPLTGRSG